ncbi:hypothetical protein CANCADRAFT_782 [Tortispora caseinolytica NRRL Y-17796]|uniref:Peptidase M24 domain-containing protein n=1 Tax=Tortispora caseinolytica NRRL Y-17796 TaxID=767744 RepID=A0A1E4TKB8_9ASCO|nr:hypothetical protein CANCADRAFT_782 [Tortispora caseinolytica NRRL Y-17796]
MAFKMQNNRTFVLDVTTRLVQVITIEPGIYIPENDPDVPSAYHGIGIRIEDNVCVGTKQPFVLTSAALKEVSDIENVLNE